MTDRKVLLVHVSKGNISVIAEGVNNHMQTLPFLLGSLQMEREDEGQEIRISMPCPEKRIESQPQPLTAAARAFLAQYISLSVLEVFSEWQGILIESPTLEEAVWVVRDHQSGQRLAQETGQPFILLDEILAQEGES